VVVVVVVREWEKQTVELEILYSTKEQESEDLGKVMLYLMLFLLKGNDCLST
jgi:hypothetical protein